MMTVNPIRVFAAFLVLICAAPSYSQTAGELALDVQEWARLAERAESVIAAAAASNPALEILRADLSGWSRRFSASQIPLKEEIDRLNARLAALGEPIEGEGEDSDLEALRSEIKARLFEAERPYRIAEDAVRHAEGLIDQIDTIKHARFREARAARGATPLSPADWLAAAGLTADYFAAAFAKIGTAWASAAQRKQLIQQLPVTLVWLALGGMFLTGARRFVRRFADRLFPAAEGKPPRGGGFRAFAADAVFPAIGIWLFVLAANSSRLVHYFSESFVVMAAIAASIVYVANWLAKALFAGDGSELVLSCLGNAWSRSAHRIAVSLGGAVALRTAIQGIQLDTAAEQAKITLLEFPALFAAAVLMFQLSRRLSENLAALAQIDDQRPFSDVVFAGITWLVRAAAVAGAGLAAAGYGAAGDYLVFPVLYSLALLGAFFVLVAIITGLISGFASRGGFEISSVRIGLIRVLTGATLFAAAVPAFALAWGATSADIADAWQRALEGIPVGSQRITAADVLRFVATFAAGCVLTALIQSILQRSVLPNTRLNTGAQRALITGTGYVGVILAGIVAVAMTNFDFTSIAIVAGALSVGIGFGLQTVVSNFASGIILLIERPINVGDWVEVGGVSGTVQNVSVRATQIETFDRSRVVVPNTDLIGGRVTNWTLVNRRGRVILPVGVAYGTDPRRIERMLLDIAMQHPAVLEDPPPAALFMNFGADALEFELRVILNDVNLMLTARSDLNFAIAERFEREGISIPFPQRDIWVRNASDLFPNSHEDRPDEQTGESEK